jgi:hypothetical protein
VIYAIEERDSGRIKIGFGGDPHVRLKQCQTGNSADLRLLAWCHQMWGDSERDMERSLHEFIRTEHVRGEWFYGDKTKDVVAWLASRQCYDRLLFQNVGSRLAELISDFVYKDFWRLLESGDASGVQGDLFDRAAFSVSISKRASSLGTPNFGEAFEVFLGVEKVLYGSSNA